MSRTERSYYLPGVNEPGKQRWRNGTKFQYEDVEFDIHSLAQRPAEHSWNLRVFVDVSVQQETGLSVPESGPTAGLPDQAYYFSKRSPPAQSDSSRTLESSETLLPSILEETESFGLKVVDIIAECINDSCSTKPLHTKLKEFQDKYKTPENCKVLFVPTVNLELWMICHVKPSREILVCKRFRKLWLSLHSQRCCCSTFQDEEDKHVMITIGTKRKSFWTLESVDAYYRMTLLYEQSIWNSSQSCLLTAKKPFVLSFNIGMCFNY